MRRRKMIVVAVVALLWATSVAVLSSCTNPAQTFSFSYTLRATGANEATGVTCVNGSGGNDNPGTVSLPWTSQTYTATDTGGHFVTPQISGTFTGSGSIAGIVTIFTKGAGTGNQWAPVSTNVSGTSSVPFDVTG